VTTEPSRRGRTILGTALMIVGVLGLAVAAWSRLLHGRDRADPRLVLLVAAGVVVLICAGLWWWSRRSGTRQTTIAAARPGWSLHEVWADESLQASLAQHGVGEPGMRASGGTRLTLAWSTSGVALWRGNRRSPHEVASLPWSAVAAVTGGVGYAASSARPAVVVRTRSGVELVVVPAARATGGLLPAGGTQVEQLVTKLQEARDQGLT
jgi:hypothetical protein